MNLLPEVKKLELKEGLLTKKYIAPFTAEIDCRIKKAISKLPTEEGGSKLSFNIGDQEGEKYTIDIESDRILVSSNGLRGAFYAVQTLRQIFKHDEIPCVHIEDEPDLEYRGLYHDVTRGKVAEVKTIKKLIDDMAYYKLNSLQLYIEHTFEFEETKNIIKNTGYMTKEEIRELDDYCNENFIEFIPSIATFGHMYEILQQDEYKHLRVLKNYEALPNFWQERMDHHTIDPLNEDSFKLVTSLIDQYYPLFRTDTFNICGDETFDLGVYKEKRAELYTDFIKKIISYLSSKNKKVMMWADILLKHPETIGEIPDDVYCLNWCYSSNPSEDNIIKLAELGKKQIVCPGTSTWEGLCENIEVSVPNITRMIDYGYKHGAVGLLNTNWGDWGNPASIELAMYSIVLGAAKSWSVKTEINDNFDKSIDMLLYGYDGAADIVKRTSKMHNLFPWKDFWRRYFHNRYNGKADARDIKLSDIVSAQKEYLSLKKELLAEKWESEEIKEELLICIEGICVMAELSGKLEGMGVDRITDTQEWLNKYRQKWLEKNKESEFVKIEEMFLYLESI